MTRRVLVVAGEASGDRAAAAVVARLAREGVSVFGMGGDGLAQAGADLVTHLGRATAVGFGEVARRGWSILAARAALDRAVSSRGPLAAALLVNYTEFNTSLAKWLKRRGVRVLWYIAPQIWAWRPSRSQTLAKLVDRMAVILPFEERLWRDAGVDARYVGHPALEDPVIDRATARATFGLTEYAPAIAILPGSRPHEVRELLGPMLHAYEIVRRDRASLDARIIAAASLDRETVELLERASRVSRVPLVRADATRGAGAWLGAFDAALCASGTASLEAALAGAPPVVSYRVGWLTEAIVRPFLQTDLFALPNVLLKRRAFPELMQRDATVSNMALALERVLGLDRREMQAACDELRPIFGARREPSREVADMITSWL